MMTGYIGDDKANEEAFTHPEPGHPDRWLRTGDRALIDDGGRLKLTGRSKEILKVSGFQVSPRELEELLFCEPDLADAAIIGVPDEKRGEAPWAYLVVAPQAKDKDRSELEESVLKSINGKVAGYKKIKGVTWIDAIPKRCVPRCSVPYLY